MPHNGHLQVVVADFEERQCPVGHDGQERSRDNANQRTRNAMQFVRHWLLFFTLIKLVI